MIGFLKHMLVSVRNQQLLISHHIGAGADIFFLPESVIKGVSFLKKLNKNFDFSLELGVFFITLPHRAGTSSLTSLGACYTTDHELMRLCLVKA